MLWSSITAQAGIFFVKKFMALKTFKCMCLCNIFLIIFICDITSELSCIFFHSCCLCFKQTPFWVNYFVQVYKLNSDYNVSYFHFPTDVVSNVSLLPFSLFFKFLRLEWREFTFIILLPYTLIYPNLLFFKFMPHLLQKQGPKTANLEFTWIPPLWVLSR